MERSTTNYFCRQKKRYQNIYNITVNSTKAKLKCLISLGFVCSMLETEQTTLLNMRNTRYLEQTHVTWSDVNFNFDFTKIG